jgi:hypothetical protein
LAESDLSRLDALGLSQTQVASEPAKDYKLQFRHNSEAEKSLVRSKKELIERQFENH